MKCRVLVVMLIVVLAAMPVAQASSAPHDTGHAAALKHAPRTPPSAAPTADVVRSLPVMPSTALTGLLPAPQTEAAWPVALATPFVPPRT